MLYIQGDVWREDCVSMIGINAEENCTIVIRVVDPQNYVKYHFESAEEAKQTQDALVKKWESFFDSPNK